LKDVNKYRRIYHLIIASLTFVLLWFVIYNKELMLISVDYIKFSIISGLITLFISLILKRFKNIITISIIAISGISLLVLIYENNIIFGYVFYSLSYSILSADAVYSQNGLKNKIFIFLITFIAFSVFFTILNFIGDSEKPLFTRTNKSTEQSNKVTAEKPDSQKVSIDSNPKTVEDLVKTEQIKKISKSEFEKQAIRNEIFLFLTQWKDAWESRNIKKYKSFYSEDFIGIDKNGKQYSYSERMKAAEKTFKQLKSLEIYINNTIYEFDDDYPNEVTVKFDQTYNSNTFNDYGRKTLMIFKGKSTNYKWKIYREKFETIEQQKQVVQKQSKEESSFFGDVCYGVVAIIALILIFAFIKFLLE